MHGKIVRHQTNDGLYLTGIYNEKKTTKAVFLTHGWAGDILRDPYYDAIFNAAERKGQAFLIGQNRGTGNEYGFLQKDGSKRTIGSNHEKFIECINDFEAWLYFLYLKGYREVTLIGHSFAAHKIVYFASVRQHAMISKIVLLSPFDIFDLFASLLEQSDEDLQAHLLIAKKMIDAGSGETLMPDDALWFPISANGFYDHFGPNSALHIFDFNYNKDFNPEILKRLLYPTLAVLGSSDPYVRNHKEFLNAMKNSLPKGKVELLRNANHSFWRRENGIEDIVFKWI